MSTHENDSSASSPESQERGNEITLSQLFSSDEWREHFHQLAQVTGFSFSVFDEEGAEIITAGESPLCEFIKSAGLEKLDCPAACYKRVHAEEIIVSKCSSRLMYFILPIERFGSKVRVLGRGGFAEYDDLLEFTHIVMDNNLPRMPAAVPLDFLGEDHVKTICRYTRLTLSRLLDSVEEKDRLEEKLLRMTALFDTQTFGILSKNPQLLYRYILDTIEFVFGTLSSSLFLYDDKSGNFQPVSSAGIIRDALMKVRMSADNPVVAEMRSTRAVVYRDSLEEAGDETLLSQAASAYFFPVFMGSDLQGAIAIFDKRLSRQDIKVMSAFIDYVQLNLENHDLRIAAAKSGQQADQKMDYMTDFLSSIVSVLERKVLLNTLLDKTLDILKAEQGSLMIMDSESSEFVIEAYKSLSGDIKEKMRIKKGEGIAGMVIDSGTSLLVEDIEQDPRIKQENRPHYKSKSFISALISIENRVKGVFNVSDKEKGEAFNEDDLHLLQSIINNSAIAIERSLLHDQTEELRKLSITDPLTGIYNRRYLNRRLSEEITRYNRYKHPFSFMMLDLDKFKEYNDTFGHIAGDNLIKTLAHITEKSLRVIDIAARFGGDEFVAIFPQTSKVDAIQITNRIKDQVDRALTEHNIEMPLTISIGLATYPDDASSIMELIEKTDQALYLAKKGGGNKVVYL